MIQVVQLLSLSKSFFLAILKTKLSKEFIFINPYYYYLIYVWYFITQLHLLAHHQNYYKNVVWWNPIFNFSIYIVYLNNIVRSDKHFLSQYEFIMLLHLIFHQYLNLSIQLDWYSDVKVLMFDGSMLVYNRIYFVILFHLFHNP
jgi:hypothetical protein